MILYEFTYSDTLNQTKEQVRERVEKFLESDNQLLTESLDWKPGYKLHQVYDVDTFADGSKQYTFHILGDYRSDDE